MRRAVIVLVSVVCAFVTLQAQRMRVQTVATTVDFGGYRSTMQGMGTLTKGGEGGTIYRVTSLSGSGANTLRAAMEASGCRVVVFETSGTINLGGSTIQVKSADSCLTVAGQTAPSPGVQVINGNIEVTGAHDVVLQHFRIYTGDVGEARIPLFIMCGAYNVVIDHMTPMWGTSSNISISPGNDDSSSICGTNPYDVAVIESMPSEMLGSAYSGGGTRGANFIAYPGDACAITLARSLMAHGANRNPWIGVGCRALIQENVAYNASHISGSDDSNFGFVQMIGNDAAGGAYSATTSTTEVAIVANRFIAGPDTLSGTLPYKVGFTSAQVASNKARVYLSDNNDGSRFILGSSTAQQWAAMGVMSGFGDNAATPSNTRIDTPDSWYTALNITPRAVAAVETYVLAHAGARPTDRDATETRVVSEVTNRNGVYKYKDASTATSFGGATYSFLTYAANIQSFTISNPNDPGTCGSYWDASVRSKLMCQLETAARAVEP